MAIYNAIDADNIEKTEENTQKFNLTQLIETLKVQKMDILELRQEILRNIALLEEFEAEGMLTQNIIDKKDEFKTWLNG